MAILHDMGKPHSIKLIVTAELVDHITPTPGSGNHFSDGWYQYRNYPLGLGILLSIVKILKLIDNISVNTKMETMR